MEILQFFPKEIIGDGHSSAGNDVIYIIYIYVYKYTHTYVHTYIYAS